MNGLLKPAQIAQFKHDGYLVLRQRAPADLCARMLSAARQQLDAVAEPVEYETDLGYAGAPTSRDAPGGRTVRRLHDAWLRGADFQHWAQEPSLIADLQTLLGEPVCLTLAHHNSIMTKHPSFGTATGWHRDIRYWSFARPDLISAWLALGPENSDNGGLKFIPASHSLQIARSRLDERDFLRPDLPENQAMFAYGVTLELQQGDLVLFHSGLFHAAGKNESDQVKISLVFAYRGSSNLPNPDSRSAAAGDICFG